MYVCLRNVTVLYGMECFFKIFGDKTVVLCLKNAGHLAVSYGKSLATTLSNRRPCASGIAYLEQADITYAADRDGGHA